MSRSTVIISTLSPPPPPPAHANAIVDWFVSTGYVDRQGYMGKINDRKAKPPLKLWRLTSGSGKLSTIFIMCIRYAQCLDGCCNLPDTALLGKMWSSHPFVCAWMCFWLCNFGKIFCVFFVCWFCFCCKICASLNMFWLASKERPLLWLTYTHTHIRQTWHTCQQRRCRPDQ